MPLETATFINQLDAANPLGSDPIASGDDHLRLIKSTLKSTFPSISGAVTKTHTEINTAVDQAGTAVQPSALTAAIAAVKEALYPVGSVYINATNATNPATLMGFGTWVEFGSGRVLVGQNASDASFDTLEKTGGSKDTPLVSHSHTFSATTDTQGSHSHTINSNFTGDGVNSGAIAQFYNFVTITGTSQTSTAGAHSHTVSGTTSTSGSSGANGNLQPYIVVKMWKRTA